MKCVKEIKYEAMEINGICAVYNQITGNLILNTFCKDHKGKVIVLGLMDKKQRRFQEHSCY